MNQFPHSKTFLLRKFYKMFFTTQMMQLSVMHLNLSWTRNDSGPSIHSSHPGLCLLNQTKGTTEEADNKKVIGTKCTNCAEL